MSCDATGAELGLVARRFWFTSRTVYHDFLVRTSPTRGAMKAIQRCGLATYDRLGVAEIHLTAGLTAGPVVWARAGFEFAHPVHSTIAQLMLGAADPHLLALGPTTTPQDLLELSDPAGDWCIADFVNAIALAGFPTGTVDQMLANGVDIRMSRPLGEAVLYAVSPWRGLLRIALDSDGRDLYERVISAD